jgi:hypothetical protein
VKEREMKKSNILIGFLVLFVSSCTSTPEPKKTKNNASIKTEFLGGGLTIAYDKNGEFQSITSISTSKITSTLPSAVEEAIKIATLKARRQIAEFIGTEVKSHRFTSSISNSLQASQISDSDDASKIRNTIALKVRENITQKSNQILKGTFVKSEKHDNDKNLVVVTVVSGIGTVGTSEQLKKLFAK